VKKQIEKTKRLKHSSNVNYRLPKKTGKNNQQILWSGSDGAMPRDCGLNTPFFTKADVDCPLS